MESFLDEPSHLTGIIVGTLIFGAALRWLFKNEADGDDEGAAPTASRERADDVVGGVARSTKSPGGDDDVDDDGRKSLRDVFSVKQGPVLVGGEGEGGDEERRASSSSSASRPFESSYYFAHNGHSTG
jgi:hypothetical protein